MKALFPKPVRQRYWKLHYTYVLHSLQDAGFSIAYETGRDLGDTRFRLGIFEQEIVVDFRDFYDLHPIAATGIPYFKFHRNQEMQEQYPNVFPLGPVSVDNWAGFRNIRNTGNYQATGDRIMNNQRPYGDAKIRRKQVRNQLAGAFGRRLDFRMHRQEDFWRRGQECLVSVCVPGARNDILDRGQVQFMGLGICTVSPRLEAELAYGQILLPGTHYVECQADYQDLPAVVRWCEQHRSECVEIGRNAQRLFDQCCLPKAKWEYVRQVWRRSEYPAGALCYETIRGI